MKRSTPSRVAAQEWVNLRDVLVKNYGMEERELEGMPVGQLRYLINQKIAERDQRDAEKLEREQADMVAWNQRMTQGG
jgi:hypothetical protein